MVFLLYVFLIASSASICELTQSGWVAALHTKRAHCKNIHRHHPHPRHRHHPHDGQQRHLILIILITLILIIKMNNIVPTS